MYAHFRHAKLLGLTATPFRSDARALGDTFDTVCFDYGLEKGISDGWLSPIVSETIPLEIDLSHVSLKGGDFDAGELDDAITPMMRKVAAKLRAVAKNRKMLVFLPTVSASKRFAGIMAEEGFNTGHVDGESKDRKEILARFAEGEIGVLCNSQLLIEGYDEPSIDCIVILTPTKSTLRYIQMVGRGTRPCPEVEKKHLYLPDFLWHGAAHNLCHPSCLVAKTEEVAEKMTSIMQKGGAKSLEELEAEAHALLISERELALAKNLKSFIGNTSQKFDPVLKAISLLNDQLIDWHPEVASDALPINQYQEQVLKDNGFDPTDWKRGYAADVMEIIADRRSAGLASPKQVRMLHRHGYGMAHKMTAADATRTIDALMNRFAAMKNRGYRKKK